MENKTIYAGRVSPERKAAPMTTESAGLQKSDIFNDDYFNEIIVKGNENYPEYNGDLFYRVNLMVSFIVDNLYDSGYYRESITEISSESDYKKAAEWLSDNYKMENHKVWTVEETKNFLSVARDVEKFGRTECYKADNYCEDLIAVLLSLYTEDVWEWAAIQGDIYYKWNRIYYPKDKYTDKDLELV